MTAWEMLARAGVHEDPERRRASRVSLQPFSLSAPVSLLTGCTADPKVVVSGLGEWSRAAPERELRSR